METKANYVLVGLFTLAGILGALGLLLWLAKVEVDRQYTYYDILFSDVSGLGAASDVRYNGLPAGQVVDLGLDEEDSSQVRVRIEVGADTPVNSETVAKLQSQGVTGVSFVGLSGGSDMSTPLPQNAVIPSERTALQSVFEGAPELLDRAIVLLENVNDVFDTDNREAVSTLLGNLATSSERLDGVLANFEMLSDDLGAAAREVAAFTGQLEQLSVTADTTLTTATTTLETATGAIEAIETFTTSNLVPLTNDLRATSQTANRVIDDVGTRTAALATRFDTLTGEASQALATFSTTMNNADETLGWITTAMTRATDTLDIAARTFDNANKVIRDDIGGIITDLRNAATAFTNTIQDVSTNIDAVSTEVLAASRSAASFADTLDTIASGNERQISEFLRLGLPEFLRFVERARSLTIKLERLVNKIERDPGRFLLGTQNSRFSR